LSRFFRSDWRVHGRQWRINVQGDHQETNDLAQVSVLKKMTEFNENQLEYLDPVTGFNLNQLLPVFVT
jgi:hypothetical protein